MAFPQETNRIATYIGNINVILFDDENSTNQSARITIDVLDQDHQLMKHHELDLVPHITQAQIDGLIGFLDDIRVQAEAELLP